jgi:hypothetical protein
MDDEAKAPRLPKGQDAAASCSTCRRLPPETKPATEGGNFGPTWPEVCWMKGTEPRELTREERTAIRKLVVSMCANYDNLYGCLPLDCACYMLGKWWTESYCKYFQNAVLPLNPQLTASLLGGAALNLETRPCDICGQAFPVSGKQAYCSTACADKARKKRQREYMRKKRGSVSF